MDIVAKTKKGNTIAKFKPEEIEIGKLVPHKQNYRSHPEDQLEHITKSIADNGFYRNIVVAKDNTILAGHGVVEAARKMGVERVPVIRVNISPDDPRALKILIGDNEISKLGEVNDRALTDMLKQIREFHADGLLGTGFTEETLASLIFITRPQSEIGDFNAAAEWAGMPEYEAIPPPLKIIVSFDSVEARADFAKHFGYAFTEQTKSVWWPPKERDDVASVRFE